MKDSLVLDSPNADFPLVDDTSKRTRKQKIWSLLEDPSSSYGARLFSVAMMLVIILSALTFCLESLPQYYHEDSIEFTVWDGFEMLFVAVFTIDYLLRLFSCPQKLVFIVQPLNVIDLLAILPFFVQKLFLSDQTVANSAVFRVVRLVRVFRIFKVSRHLSWIKIFGAAMRMSIQPLTMLLFVIICVSFKIVVEIYIVVDI